MNTKVCFIELCKNTNYPEEKKMLFDFDRLLSRAHIQSISFTFFVYFEPCTNSLWPAFTLACSISFSIN